MDDGTSGNAPEGVERGRMSADELSWALRAVNRAAAELDQALASKVGLRPLDYEAMGHIMDMDGTQLGPAELGHKLGISTGSATELVDRLEGAGHIMRTRDESDRRRVNLTPQSDSVGRILGELNPLFQSLDDLALEFTAEQREAIGRYLRSASAQLTRHASKLAGESRTAQ